MRCDKWPSQLVDEHLKKYPSALALKQIPPIPRQSPYGALGVATSTWLIFQILEFVKQNPDKIVNAGNRVLWCVENFDNIANAWAVCDAVGLEQVVRGVFFIHEMRDFLENIGWEDVASLLDGVDVVESAASMGLGLLLGTAITSGFNWLNQDKKQLHVRLRKLCAQVEYVTLLASKRAHPALLNKELNDLPVDHREI